MTIFLLLKYFRLEIFFFLNPLNSLLSFYVKNTVKYWFFVLYLYNQAVALLYKLKIIIIIFSPLVVLIVFFQNRTILFIDDSLLAIAKANPFFTNFYMNYDLMMQLQLIMILIFVLLTSSFLLRGFRYLEKSTPNSTNNTILGTYAYVFINIYCKTLNVFLSFFNNMMNNIKFLLNRIETLMFCWSVYDFIAHHHTYNWSDVTEFFKNTFIWSAPVNDALSVGDDWIFFSLLIFITSYCMWLLFINLQVRIVCGPKPKFTKSKSNTKDTKITVLEKEKAEEAAEASAYNKKKAEIIKPNYITSSFFMFLALFLNICLLLNISYHFNSESFNFITQHEAKILWYSVKILLSIVFIVWWILFILRFNTNKQNALNSEYSCEVMLLYMILSFLFFTLTSVIDILTFILIIETTSLIITILGAKSLKTFKYHNLKPIEGSLRFFVFNALNTGFVLVGVGLLYWACGSLYFWDIGKLCEHILEMRESMPLEAKTWKGGVEKYYEERVYELHEKTLWTVKSIWNNTYYFPRLTGHSATSYDPTVNENMLYYKFNQFMKNYWTTIKLPHILDPVANAERNYGLLGYYSQFFDLPHKTWFRFFLISEFLNKESPILNDIIDLNIAQEKLAWIGDLSFTVKLWDLAAKYKISWNPNKGTMYSFMYYFFSGNQYLLRNFLINHHLLWYIDNWLFIEMRNSCLTSVRDPNAPDTFKYFLRNTTGNTEFEYRKKHGDLYNSNAKFESFVENRPREIYRKLVLHLETKERRVGPGVTHYKTVEARYFGKPKLIIVGLFLFLLVFAFKLTWFPFHEWMLQLYKGCGILFVCYLATIPKIAVWFIFSKIYVIYFPTFWLVNAFFFFGGIVTIIVALLYFSVMRNIIGVIAWSSVLTSGFLLIYVTYAIYYNALILVWIVYYIITYTIGILLIFFSVFINTQVLFIEFKHSFLEYRAILNETFKVFTLRTRASHGDWDTEELIATTELTPELVKTNPKLAYAKLSRMNRGLDPYSSRSDSRILQRPITLKYKKSYGSNEICQKKFFVKKIEKPSDINSISLTPSQFVDYYNNIAAQRKLTLYEAEQYVDALIYLGEPKLKILYKILSSSNYDKFRIGIITSRLFSEHFIKAIFQDTWLHSKLKFFLPKEDKFSFKAYVESCQKQLSDLDYVTIFEFNHYFPHLKNTPRKEIINFYYALVNRINEAIDEGILKDLPKLNPKNFNSKSPTIADDYFIDLLPHEVIVKIIPDIFEKGIASIYRQPILDAIENSMAKYLHDGIYDTTFESFLMNNVEFSKSTKYRKMFLKDFLGYFHRFDILNAFVTFNLTDNENNLFRYNSDPFILNNILRLYDAIDKKIRTDYELAPKNNNNDTYLPNMYVNESVTIFTNIINKNEKPYEPQTLEIFNDSGTVVNADMANISEVSGFGVLSKVQAFYLCVGCFLCVGLPPFGLFFIKFIFLLLGGAWGFQSSQILFSLFPMIWSFGIFGNIVRNVWGDRTNSNMSTPKTIAATIILFLQTWLVLIVVGFVLFGGLMTTIALSLFFTRFQ